MLSLSRAIRILCARFARPLRNDSISFDHSLFYRIIFDLCFGYKLIDTVRTFHMGWNSSGLNTIRAFLNGWKLNYDK